MLGVIILFAPSSSCFRIWRACFLIITCIVLCLSTEDIDIDFDEAFQAFDDLEQKLTKKREEAYIDVEMHRRIISKLSSSEYFAHSEAERDRSKHPEVKFEVGQVVRHTIWGYTAVIVGWDEFCKAPENWIQQMFGHKRAPKNTVPWRVMPNYSVLVLEGGSGRPEDTRYVPQVNIKPIKASLADIESPETEHYFKSFHQECSRFIPKAWLQQRYPEDTTCISDYPLEFRSDISAEF